MILAALEENGLALAKARRARTTGPTGHRHLLVLGAVAIALLFTLQLAVADNSGTRSAVGAARHENGVLRMRQEALRAELFEVARRLEVLELGRQTPGGYDSAF